MGFRDFITKIFPPKVREVPADLQLYNAARDRLDVAAKNLIKEVDDFGKMYVGMRGERPKAEPQTKKRKARKKCTPSRSR